MRDNWDNGKNQRETRQHSTLWLEKFIMPRKINWRSMKREGDLVSLLHVFLFKWMSNNTEIKEFKTELCAQPCSWFLMIFNFGRSLTCCTWAVFLILNYTCNSSWSECSWGASIRLPVRNENASHVLTPGFLLHIRNAYGVISLDSFGKQTNKTCEISCLE